MVYVRKWGRSSERRGGLEEWENSRGVKDSTEGRNGGDDLTELEAIQDSGLTGGIKADLERHNALSIEMMMGNPVRGHNIQTRINEEE